MMLKIGKVVKHYGKVAAVGMREGERYYMFIDKNKCVSLIPASVVEE